VLAAGVYAGAATLAGHCHRADHVLPAGHGPGIDVLLVLWILKWVAHALWTAPSQLFAGNILHPTPDVVTLSEHLIGLQPIFAPVWAWTGNAVLAFNVVVFASFVGACHASSAADRERRRRAVAGLAFMLAPCAARLPTLAWRTVSTAPGARPRTDARRAARGARGAAARLAGPLLLLPGLHGHRAGGRRRRRDAMRA
jgi:hypothetical protein